MVAGAQFDLLPTRENVWVDIDPITGRCILTHGVTQERIELPEVGEWHLASDEDGFSYLVDDAAGKGTEMDVDDFFSEQHAEALDSKREVILHAKPQGKNAKRSFSFLDSSKTQFKEERFLFKAGPTLADRNCDTAVFARARNGFSRFWRLTSIYVALAFSMLSNTPSRWAWQSLPRFEKSVARIADGQVLRSQSFDELQPGESLEDRCLPWHSVSTMALLALLAQWTGCSTRMGGLKQPRHQEAAKAFLKALVDSVCAGKEHRVQLFVDDGFEWRWPRPPMGTQPYSMVVQGGEADTGGLFEYCRRNMYQQAAQWQEDIKFAIEGVGLVALLVALAASGGAKSLFNQLCLWLGQMVEQVMAKQRGKNKEKGEAAPQLVPTECAKSMFAMNRRLARYMLSTKNYVTDMGEVKLMSIATDKSQVGGLPIQNSFCQINGSGCVFAALTQVDKDYDGSLPEADKEASRKRKRDDKELQGKKAAIGARQRAWFQRFVAAGNWRPKVVPRKAAYRWLLAIDNVIRQHTPLQGLVHFKAPDNARIRNGQAPDPLQWPHCSIAMDRGSDGVAGLHFAQRYLHLNCEEAYDASHDGWRDWQRMLRETGGTAFWYLFLIVSNLLHGPFLESPRWNAMREAMDELWGNFSERTCDIFKELSAHILSESGMSTTTAAEDLKEFWKNLPDDEIYRKKGYKVNMNRFWHGPQEAWVLARSWSKMHMSLLCLALETGVLQKGAMCKVYFKTSSAGSSTAAQSTSVEESALKHKLNALTASVVFLSDRRRLYRLRAILVAGRPVEDWHRWQAHFCREVDKNFQWYFEQVSGSYMKHIVDIWARCAWCAQYIPLIHMLLCAKDVEWIGMWVRSTSASPAEDSFEADDSLAVIVADLVLAMISARATRAIYLLRGWPSRTVRMLSDVPATVAQTKKSMQEDYNAFLRLQAAANAGDKNAEVLTHRSSFALAPVQQEVLALQNSPAGEFEPYPDFLAWLRKKHHRLIGSLICEDAFNSQKNSNTIKGKRRYMAPNKATNIILNEEVAAKIHRYQPLEASTVGPTRVQKLQQDAFRCNVKAASQPFADIKKGGATPAWHSKPADWHPQPSADLQLMHDSLASGQFDPLVVGQSWLGDFVSFKHHIALQPVGKNAWYIALKHIPGSSCVVWPAVLKDGGGNEGKYFVPKVRISEPVLISLYNIEEWRASPFLAKSPASQFQSWPKARAKGWIEGVRLTKSGETEALAVVAARAGFWQLTKTFLTKLAALVNLAVPQGCPLVDLVWLLCEHFLPDMPADDARMCVQQRLVLVTEAVEGNEVEHYSDVPELSDVLEQRDEKSVIEEAKSHEEDKVLLQEAKDDFVKKVAAKCTGRGGRKGAILNAQGKKYPKSIPQGVIDHASAKALSPPDSYVWRRVPEGRWCGQLKPFGEISRSWATHGERGALVQVLEILWEQYLGGLGLTSKSCPIQGLFDST